MKMRCIRPTAIAVLVLTSLTTSSQIVYPPVPKKLVEFSWSSPTTRLYEANTEVYDSGPFDGISVKLSGEVASGNIFMVDNWKNVPDEEKNRERKIIRTISQKSALKHNLLVLYGASQMDWFSDDDWLAVEEQLRFGASLAKTGGFIGILWDPEPYGGINPWRYPEQDQVGTYTFQDYYLKVRQRGARFMEILQDEFPGLVILSLRELSDYQTASPFSQEIVPVRDVHHATTRLEKAWWGLHLPFILGMMDAMDEGVTYVDGNEEAYFYTSALEYFELRNIIQDDMRSLVPPGLRDKFRKCYRIGHAVSVDYTAGNWVGLNSFPYRLSAQGEVLTPEQRAKWFEHNIYYALRTSDQYVWLYSENPNWFTGESVPEGYAEALRNARRKIDNSEPLGFRVEEMLKKAREAAEMKYRAQPQEQ